MKIAKHGYLSLMFLLAMGLFHWGCESVAVVGRPTLGPGAGVEEIELTAQFDGLNTRHQELYLRTGEGENRIVRYTADARAVMDGREYPVTRLQRGDIVVVHLLRDPAGETYTNLIRVRDPSAARDSFGAGTLEGRVEYVDFQRGYFEVRPRVGSVTRVYMPYRPILRTEEGFRGIRVGDYVRIQGEFIGDRSFRLSAFL